MTKHISDHIGIITACGCILHCLALPFLLIFTSFSSFEEFHAVTLILTIIITGHALWHGWKQHCKHIVVFFGGLGTLCLAAGVIAHEFAHGTATVVHGNHTHLVSTHNHTAEFIEIGVTIIGSLLIIAAHVYNLKFKKICCDNTNTVCSSNK